MDWQDARPCQVLLRVVFRLARRSLADGERQASGGWRIASDWCAAIGHADLPVVTGQPDRRIRMWQRRNTDSAVPQDQLVSHARRPQIAYRKQAHLRIDDAGCEDQGGRPDQTGPKAACGNIRLTLAKVRYEFSVRGGKDGPHTSATRPTSLHRPGARGGLGCGRADKARC